MRTVGVRELKAHASELLRDVREKGETIGVTYRGEVVARLEPVKPSPARQAEVERWLADLDALAEEIGKSWPEGVSAEDAVRDIRRDL